MEQKSNLNSIYRATEGEGIFIGTPQVFVRFQGCAVGCLNCDSKDTWDFSAGHAMTMPEILKEVQIEALEGRIKRVSITGGDPLHPKLLPDVIRLAKELKERRYFVNIEAAGTRIDNLLFDLVDYISIDYKTPSTGVKMGHRVLKKMTEQFAGKFQIKAVVEDRIDFEACAELYDQLELEGTEIPFCLTPAYNLGEKFPLKRFTDILQWNEHLSGQFRVIGQQHKWVFGPDRKQV